MAALRVCVSALRQPVGLAARSLSTGLVVPKDEAEIATKRVYLNRTTGKPAELTKRRKAQLFIPAKAASQSGTAQAITYSLIFDNEERFTNPMMGWTGTNDTLSNLELKFQSKEDAIEYCEANAIQYEVKEPNLRVMRPKSFSDNFVWRGPKGDAWRNESFTGTGYPGFPYK